MFLQFCISLQVQLNFQRFSAPNFSSNFFPTILSSSVSTYSNHRYVGSQLKEVGEKGITQCPEVYFFSNLRDAQKGFNLPRTMRFYPSAGGGGGHTKPG